MRDRIEDACIYIFVNLNADVMAHPTYYICTSEEAKQKVKQYTTRGIVDLSTINSEQFIERWDKLELTHLVL